MNPEKLSVSEAVSGSEDFMITEHVELALDVAEDDIGRH
jgi:hypothetical protein